MRTSTAAWAAALAVMSMSGPFTTAKAAPARRVEHEQPRPIYDKLRKRQGFNDSDTPDPDPLSVPSIAPLLGDSSKTTRADPTPSPDPSRSDPDPKTAHEPLSLTSSTSRPSDPSSSDRDPDRSSDRSTDSQDPPKPTRSDSNPADSLLSSLLRPTSDSTFSLAPPRVEPSSPASPQGPNQQRPDQSSSETASSRPDQQRPDQSSSETTASRDKSDNDPLLGSITGQLSNVLPTPTRDVSVPITVDVTTVLRQTSDLPVPSIKGTGNSGPEHTRPDLLSNLPLSNLPVQSVAPTRPLGNAPDQLSSLLAQGTGSRPGPSDERSTRPNDQQSTRSGDGILPETSILPSELDHLTSALPSIPRVGTAVSRLPTSEVRSVLSSVKSEVPPVGPTGTGNLGSVLPTITGTGGLPVVSSIISDLPTVPTDTGRLNSVIPTITRTGGLPIVSSVVSDLPTVIPTRTRPLDSVIPTITGTGGLPVASSIKSDLPTVLPTGTRPLGSVIPTITGTGGLPVSSIKSDLPTVLPTGTRPLGSVIPTITGTGGLPTIPTQIPSDVPPVTLPGVSGPGTGTSPLPNPTSILSSILSSVRSEVPPNPTATVDSITSGLGSTLNSVIPTASVGTGDLSRPPVVTATVDGSTVTIAVPTNSASQSGASPAIVTAPPDSTSIASEPVVTASFNASETIASDPEPSNSARVSQSVTTSNDTVPAESKTNTPSISAVPTPPSSTKPSIPPESVAPQVSIVATGTDTRTSMTLPTTWSFAPTPSDKTAEGSTGIATAVSTTLSSVGIPTTMARLVQPPGGMPSPPANSTLIQVGFRFGLNYPFVVGKPESASQIFAYLPEGIAYGLGITKDKVLMNALMPYDTSKTMGYITTLAQTYIPHDLVDELQLNLHAPASPIYSNPSAPVNALMNMVNPTIPNIPGADMDGFLSSSSFNAAATAGAGEADGAPIGGDSGSAKRVTGTSAAIGMGAIAGAAVYAAAMIYVARRYRQRRKGHNRVSSVPTAGEMTQRSSGGMGTMFMSGGVNGRTSPRGSASNSGGRGSRTSNGSSNGRSVREQGISAPLMSENSLGWN